MKSIVKIFLHIYNKISENRINMSLFIAGTIMLFLSVFTVEEDSGEEILIFKIFCAIFYAAWLIKYIIDSDAKKVRKKFINFLEITAVLIILIAILTPFYDSMLLRGSLISVFVLYLSYMCVKVFYKLFVFYKTLLQNLRKQFPEKGEMIDTILAFITVIGTLISALAGIINAIASCI